MATGAHAQEQTTSATAHGVSISTSASCAQGDIDITYDAVAMARTTAQFTAADGAVLDSYDEVPYATDHTGVEHILLDAEPPGPTRGSIVGVYVSVGAQEPTAADSAEFFVAWRCDETGNDEGGDNVEVLACFGPYGSGPRTVVEAASLIESGHASGDCTVDPTPLDPTTSTTAVSPAPSPRPPGPGPRPAPAATPVRAVPTYTG